MKHKHNRFLKKIIEEELSNILKESMNVMIKGAKYPHHIEDLNELAYHILEKIISPILNNLPEDQKNYFRKNSISYYDMFVPDGSYHSQESPGSTGIINFYISGFTSKTLQLIIKQIFKELRHLNIKWGKIKLEQSQAYKSKVIRIPIIKNDHKTSGPPELNLANVSAYQIFHNILQYEGDYSFQMDAKELIERINSLSADPDWVKKHVKNPSVSKKRDMFKDEPNSDDDNPHNDILKHFKGATIYSGGMDLEYLWRKIEQIKEIAEWAVSNGFNEISVA